jgi:uncharacterized protein
MPHVACETVIPAKEARVFEIKAGQTLRVIDLEGEQVADIVFLNHHDKRERYCAWLTAAIHGNLLKVPVLYSNPPFMRPIVEIGEDTVNVHFPAAARCNRVRFEELGKKGLLGCQEILERILYPYGIEPHEVPDVFNAFMRVNISEDGRRENALPAGKKGDHTDFKALIDCLIAICACPDEILPTNNYRSKPLLIQVLE